MMKLAVNNIKNWIFVTGVARSGTTFVGKVLSMPLEVDYIHEPFNPLCGMPGMNNWCRYVDPNLSTPEMQQHYNQTKSIFNYNFRLRTYYSKNDPLTTKAIKTIVGSRGPFYLRLAKANIFHNTAVIKDPTGNLLAEYLYKCFSVKPVIIIKHPISFIYSLNRVNWWPDTKYINDRAHLNKRHFAEEPDFLDRKYDSRVKAAAAYWRAIYKVLLTQANSYSDWQVFTHEELSQSPIPIFKNLYTQLELPWSESIEKKIISLTTNNSSAKARQGRVQDFNRNSADIFQTCIDATSLKERKEIFEIVKDVALQVYDRQSFAID